MGRRRESMDEQTVYRGGARKGFRERGYGRGVVTTAQA
jgi:hypothetical protein